MTQPDDLFIDRNTDLDLDVDELWALISTADGWRTWLVDDVDVAITPGAEGTVTSDGVERAVHVGTVIGGRRIGFSWREGDDPSAGSYVQLDIVELPGGRSHLHITERVSGSTTTAAMSCSIAATWDIRLVSLWLLALSSPVMA